MLGAIAATVLMLLGEVIMRLALRLLGVTWGPL